MIMESGWGYASPDDPQRRLFWIVPLALLLVFLVIAGVGQWLQHQPVVRSKPPINARIYELPPQRYMHLLPSHGHAEQGSHPTSPAPSAAPSQRVPQPASPTSSHPGLRHGIVPPVEPSGSSILHESAPSHAGRTTVHHPAHAPAPSRSINWNKLNQQINSAVASTIVRSELPQIHDPHTLIARYYLKTVLSKLQRIGDMNYPGNLVGVTRIMLVIGRNGELIGYELLDSSGNPALDRVTGDIVHMSAPFAPFPDKMSQHTSRVKLIITMRYEGYRDLSPE